MDQYYIVLPCSRAHHLANIYQKNWHSDRARSVLSGWEAHQNMIWGGTGFSEWRNEDRYEVHRAWMDSQEW